LQESGRQPGYWSAPEFGSRHQELSEQAGELKAVKKISLANCFAAALAKVEKGKYTPEIPSSRRWSEKSKFLVIALLAALKKDAIRNHYPSDFDPARNGKMSPRCRVHG
jgi:hypothetical protein